MDSATILIGDFMSRLTAWHEPITIRLAGRVASILAQGPDVAEVSVSVYMEFIISRHSETNQVDRIWLCGLQARGRVRTEHENILERPSLGVEMAWATKQHGRKSQYKVTL